MQSLILATYLSKVFQDTLNFPPYQTTSLLVDRFKWAEKF